VKVNLTLCYINNNILSESLRNAQFLMVIRYYIFTFISIQKVLGKEPKSSHVANIKLINKYF